MSPTAQNNQARSPEVAVSACKSTQLLSELFSRVDRTVAWCRFAVVSRMRIEISEPRSVSNGCRAKSLLLCLGLAFTFFVTAQAQPVITAQPANQVVVLGNTAVLAGSASGTGALTYRWQKNGTNLTDNGRLSGTTTPALSVATVQGSDAGQYRLVVSNSTALATSSNATLLAVPVATWGVMRVGESNAPASATNVLAISCLAEHVLALRGDGRVVAWG